MLELLSMVRHEREKMQEEINISERTKNFEIRDIKRSFEERIRGVEFENQRLKKENETLTNELDAQDSFINNNRTSDEIK